MKLGFDEEEEEGKNKHESRKLGNSHDRANQPLHWLPYLRFTLLFLSVKIKNV